MHPQTGPGLLIQTGYNRILRSRLENYNVRGEERNPQFLSIFRVCRPHLPWGYAFSAIVGPER